MTGFTTAETPAYFLDTAEYSAKVLGFAIQRDQRIKKENSKSTKLNKNARMLTVKIFDLGMQPRQIIPLTILTETF